MQKLTKSHLERILTDGLSLRDPAFYLQTSGGRLSGSIISDSFKGKRDSERQRLIWDALDAALGAAPPPPPPPPLAYTREDWAAGGQTVGAKLNAKAS
jgi:acid stress-induced BolA-like protein IbaG/YrbA